MIDVAKELLLHSEVKDHLWDLIKIGVAFLLTTVIGAWLTKEFQRKNWEHQRRSINAERYDEQTTQIFEDISGILDQRVYRFRQIYYAFCSEEQERIDKAFSDYRDIVFAWNDRINRNYAMVEKFFGRDMRERLEEQIHKKQMILIGGILEKRRKQEKFPVEYGGNTYDNIDKVQELIDAVNADIYMNLIKICWRSYMSGQCIVLDPSFLLRFFSCVMCATINFPSPAMVWVSRARVS